MSTRQRGNKHGLGLGIVCLLTYFCFATDGIAKDQEYPTRPIEFIIGYGAGGPTDISARALCEIASRHLPQPIIAVNKPGASGVIGTAIIKEAKPDGYRIGALSRSPAFIAPLTQKVSYDTLTDFTPIAHYGHYLDPVLVRSDKPWMTWKELIEWGRKHPGETKVGMGGPKYNQVQGIILGRIELIENVKLTYVPFKSSLEALTALIGGNVDMFAVTMDAATWDYINTGRVRILSYLGKSKLPGYENIASSEEIYGLSVCNLLGVVGPKGLPPYVTKKLEEVFAKAIKDPYFIDVMKKMDTAVVYMTGEEMGRYIEKTYSEQMEMVELLRKEEAKK